MIHAVRNHSALQAHVSPGGGEELWRLNLGMKAAKKAYMKAVDSGGEQGPFLIAENVSMATFTLWSATLETCWRVSFLHHGNDRGSVFLYGDPTMLHESVAEWMNDEFVLQAGRRWKSLVQSLGGATQMLPNCIKEPDKSYTSASATSCMPKVALEVAYRNEDLNKLIKEVQDWHDAGVVLSIGIKIQAGDLKRGKERTFAIAMYWVKQSLWDKKPEVVEFSPNLCTEDNKSMFVKSFPFSYFTRDVSSAEDFLIKLDLFELQLHIMKQLHIEAGENQQMVYVDKSGGFMCGEIAACSACKVMLRESKIRCGHPDCTSWFHPTCVGLKTDAKIPNLWFCAPCLRKSEKSSKWVKF